MHVRAVVLVCALLAQLLTIPAVALANPPAPLELSELLIDPVTPQTDAHDEYTEFHNTTNQPLSLGDYRIQIGTAAPKTLPDQTIPPGGYIALTAADVTWSLVNTVTASTTTNTIKLLDSGGVVVDTTTWSTAIPGAGWMKRPDNTWIWTTTPTLAAANTFTPVPSPTPKAAPGSQAPPTSQTESEDGQVAGVQAPGDYPEILVTELLPDPASPLTDANDEFIEFYNPNDRPVDLAGYIVKTGASLTTKHTLKSAVVPAGGYLALKSALTKVSLSNSGSSLALVDPAGHQLGQTIIWPKAAAGQAWARREADTWAWTTKPTPGAANLIAAPAAKTAKSTRSATGSTKITATKAAVPKAATVSSGSSGSLLAAATSPGGSWLLFALAGLTIAYIIYEFRYDLRNLYFKLRRHPAFGRTPQPVAPGRGSDRASQ